MNVMRLSDDPVRAARYHPDVTGGSTQNMTGRMCYEATHICCNALRKNGWIREFMYDAAHYNHPICNWAAEAYENFNYVRTLGMALNQEYKDRVGQSEDYGSYEVLCKLRPEPDLFPKLGATEQEQCFKQHPSCFRDDPVEGYREYFRQVKAPKSEWNKVPRPEWLDNPDVADGVDTSDNSEPDSNLRQLVIDRRNE